MSTVNARAITFEKSSNLQAATLHPDGRLEVTFRADAKRAASTYSYANVTEAMFEEWSNAKSAGSWFDKNVKKRADAHPLVPTPPPKSGELAPPAEATAPITDADAFANLAAVQERAPIDEAAIVNAAATLTAENLAARAHHRPDPARDLRPSSGRPPVIVAIQPEGVLVDARRFYERYCDDAGWKNFQGNDCPAWLELPSKIRGHWCAVALEARIMAQRPVDGTAAESPIDQVYDERNRVVAALARAARRLGWKVGIGEHDPNDENWDPEWKTTLYIDTPNGQVSWHLHDRDRALLVGLPRYDAPWDGHSSEEKYERLGRL